MSSTFYGLQIARSGLFVSQKGLDVTGHNIANANTVGYTRQRLITTSIEGRINNGIFTYASKGQVGGGVDIQQLSQIRDSFLDMQYRRENSYLGEWTAKTDALQYIESVFREPSDAGINAVLAEFFGDLQELSKNPESKEIRTLVRQDAIKLTETLHHYYDQMVALQKEQDTAIELAVEEINDIARNIRDLNEQIFKFEAGGEKANDLRDKRNLLVDQLSSLIKIDYYESPSGRFRIDINGVPLVDHLQYREIEASKDVNNPIEGEDKLYSLKWSGTDIDVAVNGGKLKGYFAMRDGSTPDNMGIPYFVEQLNIFAKVLVQEINTVHRAGYTLPDGMNDESINGIDFFTYGPDALVKKTGASNESINVVVDKITAKNITISQKILESVYNIAASGEQVDKQIPETWGNNEIALKLVDIRNKDDIYLDGILIGGLEDFTKKIVADLAVESSHSSKMKEGQDILTYNLESQRLAVSGVSLDEEMTNMIQYQHAYSAAARVVTAIDQVLDVLINRTGLVGR